MRLRFPWPALLLALCLGGRLSGADPQPMVGPGATKNEVINAYGWPSGQSQSGTKEILTYPQGKVTLEKGRVEKIDFSMTQPWPAPRPRPGPSATLPKTAEEPVNFWITDFDRAAREAARRNARILALFTGSDWSQASKLFREQVAFQPEFINEFTGDFVFLELDFPLRTPQKPEQREHNQRLREHYGVTTYPSLLVLSRTGAVLAHVDLNNLPPGETYRARVIAALRGMRESLIAEPPPADTAPPAASPARAPEPARAQQLTELMSSARTLVILGIVAGLATSGLLFWLVWRRKTEKPPVRTEPIGMRIADAASGLPSHAELAQWSRSRLRGLVAGLAETDGYQVELRDESSDVDLALRRAGDAQPRVLIRCVAGQVPPLAAKPVRELFASMTAEGVATGWLVAPSGFSAEAQTFADANNITLLNSAHLATQLRDLPPLLLPKVLHRAARPAPAG